MGTPYKARLSTKLPMVAIPQAALHRRRLHRRVIATVSRVRSLNDHAHGSMSLRGGDVDSAPAAEARPSLPLRHVPALDRRRLRHARLVSARGGRLRRRACRVRFLADRDVPPSRVARHRTELAWQADRGAMVVET